MARFNDAMKSLLRIDPSITSTAILSKALAWAVTLSAAAWVVIGLVSLRFELGGGLDDVFYTQLIIAGVFGIGIANAFVMGAGDSEAGTAPRSSPKCPFFGCCSPSREC